MLVRHIYLLFGLLRLLGGLLWTWLGGWSFGWAITSLGRLLLHGAKELTASRFLSLQRCHSPQEVREMLAYLTCWTQLQSPPRRSTIYIAEFQDCGEEFASQLCLKDLKGMVPFNLKGIGITPCHKHKHQHQHQHFVSDALLTHILHSSYWPILKHSIFQSLWPFSFIIRSVLSQLDDFMTWEIFLFTIFFTAKNLKNIWTKISTLLK